jgi:hypothetical protein
MNTLLNRIRKVTEQTAQNLKRELRFIEREKLRLTAELDLAASKLANSIAQLDHEGSASLGRGRRPGRPPGAVSAVRGPVKGKRIRRNPEALKKYADGVYELIKKSGSAGAGGGDVRKQFPKVGQDIRAFVHKHGGYKLKTSGLKSFMRYIAA